jgi:hypothetical protein
VHDLHPGLHRLSLGLLGSLEPETIRLWDGMWHTFHRSHSDLSQIYRLGEERIFPGRAVRINYY